MAYKPALWALNCTKEALREFLPPHYGSCAGAPLPRAR